MFTTFQNIYQNCAIELSFYLCLLEMSPSSKLRKHKVENLFQITSGSIFKRLYFTQKTLKTHPNSKDNIEIESLLIQKSVLLHAVLKVQLFFFVECVFLSFF